MTSPLQLMQIIYKIGQRIVCMLSIKCKIKFNRIFFLDLKMLSMNISMNECDVINVS